MVFLSSSIDAKTSEEIFMVARSKGMYVKNKKRMSSSGQWMMDGTMQ